LRNVALTASYSHSGRFIL